MSLIRRVDGRRAEDLSWLPARLFHGTTWEGWKHSNPQMGWRRDSLYLSRYEDFASTYTYGDSTPIVIEFPRAAIERLVATGARLIPDEDIWEILPNLPDNLSAREAFKLHGNIALVGTGLAAHVDRMKPQLKTQILEAPG